MTDSKKSHPALDTNLVLSFGRPGKIATIGLNSGSIGGIPAQSAGGDHENKLQMAISQFWPSALPCPLRLSRSKVATREVPAKEILVPTADVSMQETMP